MSADMSGINTDPNYSHSQDFSFSPTASPIPQQKSDFSDFNKGYTDFLGSQATVPQLQQQYSNKFNIPYLQNTAQQQNAQVGYVGNQMQALPASVASDTANSMLTQGQKDRIVQSRQAPLMQQYQNLSTAANNTNTALGTAQGNVNQAVNSEQAQQMKMTQPWLQKYDEMNIMNAAERTQWTQSNQWELDNLLANQQSGIQLSTSQQNRMAQLAMQENQFQNDLALQEKMAGGFNSSSFKMWGNNAS